MIYVCILCCIFLVNYSDNFVCLATHTGNGCGHIAQVNITSTDLLHSYNGDAFGCLDFFVHVVYLLKLCMSGCSAVLAWLHL